MNLKVNIILFLVVYLVFNCNYCLATEDFILPKSFFANEADLPVIEEKAQNKKEIVKPAEKTTLKNGKIIEAGSSSLPAEEKDRNIKQLNYKTVESREVNNQIVDKKIISEVKPTKVSLTSLIKVFEYSYSNTLKTTIATLSQYDIMPVSYNSQKGQVNAILPSGKELFIILLPSRQNHTYVRITPADGNYNISEELINNIFRAIDRNLYSNT